MHAQGALQPGHGVDDPRTPVVLLARDQVDASRTAERFQQLLRDEEVGIRQQAAAAAAELDDFDNTDLFIAALEDKDTDVRKTARTVLAKSTLPRAVEALRANLVVQIDELVEGVSGRDARKRTQALQDLSKLGPGAAPMVFERIASPGPPPSGFTT